MSYKVDNAVIMAAGLSSRFAPLSFEKPKALIEVKGEVLIERQIRQLKEAGIRDIIIVVGYKKEMFYYLRDKFGASIVENKEYLTRNNHSSLYVVKEVLKNTYICSADNYFEKNPFALDVDEAYYAAVYAEGETAEWCIQYDDENWITDVQIGGEDSWYMLGHVFFSEDFSRKFVDILCKEYDLEETKNKLWEKIYIEHIRELPMKIRKYDADRIYEFDSLDELRKFDTKYCENSGSLIMQKISGLLNCKESQIVRLEPISTEQGAHVGMFFCVNGQRYEFLYEEEVLTGVESNNDL